VGAGLSDGTYVDSGSAWATSATRSSLVGAVYQAGAANRVCVVDSPRRESRYGRRRSRLGPPSCDAWYYYLFLLRRLRRRGRLYGQDAGEAQDDRV
jgi:hypothetical protein